MGRNLEKEGVVFFSAKLLHNLLGGDIEKYLEELLPKVKCCSKYELYDLSLFEHLFDPYGVGTEKFGYDGLSSPEFDPKLSLLLLQKPQNIIFPDMLMRLPKVSWAMLESFGQRVVMELHPLRFEEISLDSFNRFQNPSFPWFGFKVFKK